MLETHSKMNFRCSHTPKHGGNLTWLNMLIVRQPGNKFFCQNCRNDAEALPTVTNAHMIVARLLHSKVLTFASR